MLLFLIFQEVAINFKASLNTEAISIKDLLEWNLFVRELDLIDWGLGIELSDLLGRCI